MEFNWPQLLQDFGPFALLPFTVLVIERLAASRAREVVITNVRVAVTGTLDGTPERFTAFTMDVAAECADADLARKLITVAGRACQVVNTLRQVASIAITYEGLPVELSEVAATR